MSQYIDPSASWDNFTVEEQAKILKSGRCNCHLDVSKLLALYPDVPEIHESLKNVFSKMKQLVASEGQ